MDALAQNRPKTLAVILGVLMAGVVIIWLLDREQPESVDVVREIELSFTTRTNGRIYARGVSVPFTGRVVEHYRAGQLKSRTEVCNGVL